MFTHCSVADIFKFDEPTLHKSKKKNSWQWEQCIS
jgi:hypothetical protein